MGGPSLVGIGGSGKRGSGNEQASRLTNESADMSRALFQESTPLRQELMGQGLEALRTGGIGAQMPLITRMIESSKEALSKGLFDTQQSLGTAGLARSPFAQSILASQRIAGEQNIANIAPNMAAQFVSQLPGFVGGQSNVSIGGMGQATSSASNRAASENYAYANILSSMMESAGKAGAAFAMPKPA